MAVETVAPALEAPLSPTRPARNPAHPRGSFGSARWRNDRGRGGQQRGRGRGQGNATGRSKVQNPQTPPQSQEAEQAPETEEVVASAELAKVRSNASDLDAEVCFICASPVVHNSIAPCNHRTCHICALRLRALYKTKACAHCRTHSDFVIFTDDATKRYEDFTPADFSSSDDNLGVKYENNEIFDDTVLLLRYNCPEPTCDVACRGWPDLHRHVRSVHQKSMCDLCTRNKKVFTHEHVLFTAKELQKHERYGDDNPGAIDQSGFKGHPECGFCRQRFYGDDELYTHCRDKHERCHICDRRNHGQQPQYYLDYNALEKHFAKDHFMCLDQECLEKKFVVFESEMDLKGHQLEVHPNGMSKDVRRDARRVDLSDFDYRSPHQQGRGRGREGRGGRGGDGREGRGRGRDPNADAIPQSTAQPMRRDELAYQRQLAIHSAQSVSTRTFGGQLTASEPAQRRVPQPNALPNASVAPANLDTDDHPSSAELAPTSQDRARKLRHNAVNERAANLLHNDQAKLNEFRSKVSSYRISAITSAELIDAFFTLFDTSSAELGKLIKELADLFENAQKRDDLLRSWNDWRAINEDYPFLPGPSGIPAGSSVGSLGAGGKRILKLKSSTAQSSRSAVSRQGSWGSAAAGEMFPPIASASAAPKKANPSPWLASASSQPPSSSARASPAIRPASTRAAATTDTGNADMFPALPAAQKPGMNVTRPGYTGNPVLRGNSGTSTPVNAWSNNRMSENSVTEALAQSLAADGASKKKGRKKQTLIHWG